MGCRTRVFENRNGEKTSVGRGNLSFSTINLVRIAIELMQIDEPLDALKAAWENWRQGPATNYEDVPPAYKELEKYVAKWLKKNLR